MFVARLLGWGVAAAAACVAYGVAVERTAFQVRRFSAAVLPPGSAPLRVLHVSDLHLLPRQGRKRDFILGLAGLEPDLVISTGDHISSPAAISALSDSLGRLKEVPGAFVFGSNDFVAPKFTLPTGYLIGPSSASKRTTELPTDELRQTLEGFGWVYLEERNTELTVAGQRIALRGTGDAHHDKDDYEAVAGPVPDDVLTIGVTHAPYLRVLDAMTADGVGLILAGHTHGGQVCAPGHGALVTNCDLPPEHAKGLFTHDAAGRRSRVHVSAGVGMSPFAPYRFACPPEVSLLTLTARP